MDVAAKMISLFYTPLGIHIQKLILGLILFSIGVLVAKLFQFIAEALLSLINIDKISETIQLKSLVKRADLGDNVAKFLSEIVFWLVLLFGGIKIVYLLSFNRALEILRIIVHYVSINVVSAAFILTLAVVFASFISGMILFIGGLINIPGYKLIARFFQYAVVIYGVVFSLDKLGISTETFLMKPDIILGFFALAGAIAFGLGCKDIAESFLANFLRNSR